MNISQEKPPPGKTPRRQRRRGFFHRLNVGKLGILDVANRWWRLGNSFFNWWHPPADSAYPGYGYYGHSQSNRLSRAWRRLRHKMQKRKARQTFPPRVSGVCADWWYPPAKDCTRPPGTTAASGAAGLCWPGGG